MIPVVDGFRERFDNSLSKTCFFLPSDLSHKIRQASKHSVIWDKRFLTSLCVFIRSSNNAAMLTVTLYHSLLHACWCTVYRTREWKTTTYLILTVYSARTRSPGDIITKLEFRLSFWISSIDRPLLASLCSSFFYILIKPIVEPITQSLPRGSYTSKITPQYSTTVPYTDTNRPHT